MNTLTQLTTWISQLLQDTGASEWGATELTSGINEGKIHFAEFIPHRMKYVLTTDGTTRDLDLSSITDLIKVLEVEYEIDEVPKTFRNFEVRGRTLSLKISSTPAASESVHVWVGKPHVIMSATDLIGAVDLGAGYAAGIKTIHIDAMGASDTLEAGAAFTIAGLSGTYHLTASATMSTNEGDISFTPGLASAVLDNAVITFQASTLDDPRLERLFVNLVAGEIAISKASQYGRNTLGVSGNAYSNLLQWGNLKKSEAERALFRMSLKQAVLYPED